MHLLSSFRVSSDKPTNFSGLLAVSVYEGEGDQRNNCCEELYPPLLPPPYKPARDCCCHPQAWREAPVRSVALHDITPRIRNGQITEHLSYISLPEESHPLTAFP